TPDDINLLNKYYRPDFKSSSKENYITLTTHNYKAAEQNKRMLKGLSGKAHFYSAEVEGEFSEYAYPVEGKLELKVGAQVMFIKNDPT
ncbi:hypothetical protein, partial [Listeria monocytogenes]|uniref:hypothetical protein n=1 Tax=Listeria monocytogenes TaxID=1639 RepID=UPI003FA41B42